MRLHAGAIAISLSLLHVS